MGRLHRLWGALLRSSPRRAYAAVWAALAVPFVIAAVVLVTRHWYPVLDLAMTELRVRDVGGSHTPLIGLPGRIGVFPDQGSHPGPASFYLLAPTYRLVGSSAWGLLAGMIVLDLVAVGLALWIARRRGGTPLMAAVGGLLVVLVRGYGLQVLAQPWNPYLPLLFWLVVLLGTWSVLDGDVAMVVVVAATGSLCAQTHMPYLGLGLGMGALCVVSLAATWARHSVRRAEVGWRAAQALGVGLVLWAPVVVDQVRNTPGNLSMLSDYFRHPPEEPVGPAEGVRLMLRHLDLARLVRGAFDGDGSFTRAGFDLDGSVVPGALVLVLWVLAAVWAWRHGHRLLRSLHVVLGWAMLLGAVSMGRIFGKVWYYLTLWAWTTAVLVGASLVWTVAAALRGHAAGSRTRVAIAGMAAAVVVVSYGALTVEAFSTEAPEQHLSDTLGHLVEPTADALRAGVGDVAGSGGSYIVTWSDARYFGSQGYGLVSELERRGFDVGVPATWRVPVTAHRVIEADDATAEVRLATGVYIDEVADLPGAVEVVRYDPRDADGVAEFERLAAHVAQWLSDAGLDDLVALLDTNLFGLQLDPRVAPEIQAEVDRMLLLGTPTAVFIVPAGTGG